MVGPRLVMEENSSQKRQRLTSALHRLADTVHQISGRTDQSLYDIIAKNPSHAACKAYREADLEYREFELEEHAYGSRTKETLATVERHNLMMGKTK